MNSVPLPPPTKFITWDSDPYCLRMWLYLETGGFGLVANSCLTLATVWTVACQTPLSIGFSRQEHWSGLLFPSPGARPDPGTEPRSPALQTDSLATELWGKPVLGKPVLGLRELRITFQEVWLNTVLCPTKKNLLTILPQRITRIVVWLPVWFFSLFSGTCRHTQSSPWTSQIIYSVWMSRLFLWWM